MTTTRELCRVLATALHVPGVDRWVEQLVNRLRLSKDWRDLGDLKRGLLDLWTEERNKHAKAVVLDIEAQRKQRKRGR